MRLNFEFNSDQVKRLRALQEETGIGSMKELFNTAFTLLTWAVNETKNGNEIAAVNEDDEIYRVLAMPALQHVATASKEERLAVGV
jgi:hypothetical protein